MKCLGALHLIYFFLCWRTVDIELSDLWPFHEHPQKRLVTFLCMPTQAAQRVGPQLNFVNTLWGGECCAATEVSILKRKQVICR